MCICPGLHLYIWYVLLTLLFFLFRLPFSFINKEVAKATCLCLLEEASHAIMVRSILLALVCYG